MAKVDDRQLQRLITFNTSAGSICYLDNIGRVSAPRRLCEGSLHFDKELNILAYHIGKPPMDYDGPHLYNGIYAIDVCMLPELL